MPNPKILPVAFLVAAVAAVSVLAVPSAALARSNSSQPVAMTAPYEYLGWGDPQPPAKVIEKTGVRDLTLAFILGHDGCNPEWDGQRPLLGGSDAAAIQAIRTGGDVDVSFGGWSGNKLGIECTTVSSLIGAYQTVIDDFGLSAIDIDIEHTEFTQAAQLGFEPYAWTIMPFDFGTPVKNMATVSIEAAEGLEANLVAPRTASQLQRPTPISGFHR